MLLWLPGAAAAERRGVGERLLLLLGSSAAGGFRIVFCWRQRLRVGCAGSESSGSGGAARKSEATGPVRCTEDNVRGVRCCSRIMASTRIVQHRFAAHPACTASARHSLLFCRGWMPLCSSQMCSRTASYQSWPHPGGAWWGWSPDHGGQQLDAAVKGCGCTLTV